MADGFTAGRDGAAAPDPARVEALRSALETGGPEAAETFGQATLKDLAAVLERIGAESRHRDFLDCRDLLRALGHPLAGLDPTGLEPRRGLAGLFDGRGARLRRFRARFEAVAATTAHIVEELQDRAGRLSRRIDTLDTLRDRMRALVIDLDAHVAAALAARLRATRPETSGLADAVADLARVVDTEGQDQPGPAMAAMATRLAEISDHAVRRLAVIRMVQNSGAAATSAIASARDDLNRWRSDWREGLGLEGRRPRRIRPDRVALSRGLATLRSGLADADQALERARERHAEAQRRL